MKKGIERSLEEYFRFLYKESGGKDSDSATLKYILDHLQTRVSLTRDLEDDLDKLYEIATGEKEMPDYEHGFKLLRTCVERGKEHSKIAINAELYEAAMDAAASKWCTEAAERSVKMRAAVNILRQISVTEKDYQKFDTAVKLLEEK